MDFLKKEFGQRLSKAIVDSGFTQEKFAEAMEFEPASVSRWVNGVNQPTGKRKSKLFELLNIDESYFLGQESAMAQPAFTLTEDQLKSIGKAAAVQAIQAANAPTAPKLDTEKDRLIFAITSQLAAYW